MQNDVPQPMGMGFPGMQGVPNIGSSFSNNPYARRFAKGGKVSLNSIRKAVDAIQSQGTGRDKILAHINPEEALELAQNHGGTLNPVTGLPQFGGWEDFWDRIFEGGHNAIDRHGEDVASFLARSLAATGGMLVGGPIGATLAASAAGAGFEGNRERPNYARGALMGALHGGVQGLAMPAIGSAFGVNPHGAMGTLMGVPKSTLGSAGRAAAFEGLRNLGTKGISTAAAQPAKSGLLSGLLGGGSQGSGLLSGIFGGGGGGLESVGGASGLLDKALLGTTILGMLGAKKERPKEPSMQDVIDAGPKWGPEHQPRRIPASDRALRHFDPNNYTPGFVPEQLYFTNVNPTFGYAHGGRVFNGGSGGQADNRPTHLPEGGYVIDASSVSDLGDGNTDAGFKKLSTLSAHLKGNYKRGGKARGTVQAHVSDGEYFVEPDVVDALGKGNNDKGASKLKKMVEKLRKQKRSNPKSLPSKSKSLSSYLGGR